MTGTVEQQRIFVFKTEEKSRDGRPYMMAFPESQITSLKTVWGGQRVYLEVNGRCIVVEMVSILSNCGVIGNEHD